MTLKDDLRNICSESGTSLFGVADADDLMKAPEGHRPSDIMDDPESVIVVGLKMLDAQMDLQSTSGDYYTISPRDDMMKGHLTFISRELDRIGYKISRYLESKGYKAYHQLASEGGVDSRQLNGLFSLKHAAREAGIGVIGRNSLLLTPEYGPRVRLTGVITNAEIEPDSPSDAEFCKDCEKLCIEACPADALQEPKDSSDYNIDKFACCNSLGSRASCRGCLTKCPVGSQNLSRR